MGERQKRGIGSARLWTSCLGIGELPAAPGTAGSAAALVLFVLAVAVLAPLSTASDPATLLSAFCLGQVFFWSAVTLGDGNRLRRYMDDSDPQTIVSDELAGQFLAFLLLVGIGHSVGQWLILALLGFVAFRIFDVLKPFGVRRLESLPAGWGILADDLLAGLYAALAVRLLLLLGTPFTGLAG